MYRPVHFLEHVILMASSNCFSLITVFRKLALRYHGAQVELRSERLVLTIRGP